MAMMSDRMTFLLGTLGGVLAGAGVVIYLVAPERTGIIAGVEGLAAAGLTVFFVTHYEMFREISARRSTRLGLNSLLMVVLFATILGIVNFLAVRHSVRWDFSETKRFTLAPQTARMLRELSREVKATVFTEDQGPARAAYRDLFDSYKAHTAKLTVDFVDPEKKPGVARQYVRSRADAKPRASIATAIRVARRVASANSGTMPPTAADARALSERGRTPRTRCASRIRAYSSPTIGKKRYAASTA